ncbi:MAG: hypothetical protein RR840_01685 [Clostridium sp.]
MLNFTNTRDVAKHVAAELNYFKKQFTGKPSDRARMEKGLWTIQKGGESIAFKNGKYAFMQDSENIYCGVCVEKGLSEELSEYYPKAMIMTDEWYYKNFITKLRIGEIKKVIEEFSASVSKPIYVEITSSTPGVKKEDGVSYIKFEIVDSALQVKEVVPTVSNNMDINELKKMPSLYLNRALSDCTSLSQIGEVMHSLNKEGVLNFILLDIFIWVPFKKADKALEGVGLNEKQIIDTVLKPLNKCIF